jgi:hypothetical protein
MGHLIELMEERTNKSEPGPNATEAVEECNEAESSADLKGCFLSPTSPDLISLDTSDIPTPACPHTPPGRDSFTSPKRRSRNGTIIGCGTMDVRLPAYASVGEIFVSNVAHSARIAGIVQYLKSKPVTMLGFDQLSHPESRRKSFLLRVPLGEKDAVLNPNFWPQGIEVRDFVRPASGRLASFHL